MQNQNQDPFKAHSQRNDNKTFLKFKATTGKYTAGADDRAIPAEAELAVNMDSYRAGFVQWVDKRPVDDRMVFIGRGDPLPRRDELGKTDRKSWERNQSGDPVDPWRLTEDIEVTDLDTGETYKFSTSTRGGMRALRNLAGNYADDRGKHPDEWPVIAAETKSWENNRNGGAIQYDPVLRIVGWVAKDEVPAVAPAAPRSAATNSEPEPMVTARDDMNDEVPF
jgi:hypothetical protein